MPGHTDLFVNIGAHQACSCRRAFEWLLPLIDRMVLPQRISQVPSETQKQREVHRCIRGDLLRELVQMLMEPELPNHLSFASWRSRPAGGGMQSQCEGLGVRGAICLRLRFCRPKNQAL